MLKLKTIFFASQTTTQITEDRSKRRKNGWKRQKVENSFLSPESVTLQSQELEVNQVSCCRHSHCTLTPPLKC